MEELLKTNDLVLISAVGAMFDEAGIAHFVADANMSILEGSLAMIPRRILVPADQITAARHLLREAGLGHELTPDEGR
ncbi:Protein of uncharacterised function (DUF2007) [Pannonibacter phragmitetus]|uniref:Protein of uncharacterized function (DUF2007) n=1 Tax=Pannonibacter phragmitetus TaxID=121719 RepID=A0A378ZXR5_9HYPH|nr:DUF2007 domain-containing protein [Pannonibacter phragmitetus]SUB01620.1 Protein of uncharacterised function (DUF2007) [Pannonibacter phragmitetus]